jgi:hypothetical protein
MKLAFRYFYKRISFCTDVSRDRWLSQCRYVYRKDKNIPTLTDRSIIHLITATKPTEFFAGHILPITGTARIERRS